jgi:RNA polymerase-binding transcription factor DksA
MYYFEFSSLLEGQRRQLFDQVREKAAGMGASSGFAGAAEPDRGTAFMDTAHANAALAAGENMDLREIEAALARIGDGSYGACIRCGREIGKARLKADPREKQCACCPKTVSSDG